MVVAVLQMIGLPRRATPRLAAAPEFAKAGVSVDLGQGGRLLRQTTVADTARCPRGPAAAIRQR